MLSLGTGELVRPIPFGDAKDWGKAGWLLPLLSCMFDGMADAANYQMQQILGDKYYRLQAGLSTGSDDMDNVTAANIEALKLEAKRLISMHRQEIEGICKILTL